MKYIITFLTILIFTSCRKENAISDKQIAIPKKNNNFVKNNNLKIIDTTIYLTKIPYSNQNFVNITEKDAEKFLYKYFKSKGALTRNEIKDYSKENLCIDYDTIYNLKLNKICCAIIRYWLNPADLNGTCVQPRMAIISKVSNRFTITNEEFLNSDFVIDSVAENQNVYVNKYDCTEHKVLRKYRLKLEVK